ncbi:1-deoxy-D-xylulose-5-phosphate synthase [Ketobacter alkanivorans]|uniref:1-deoxy-D-xylulose-5-phosphate synthase n=1 Tax=Ketobacter alkanivorans TaxID=1917421 RepID=A0A2K9LS96_9GAMM|nr:1-deoxy-D-xylulose-5-phosphate synthase [Ketobacter alkanivorans]AUM13704.1 1-deoxy-D-xylulose-5-phosphate synthase [Ketobacter alkanivorans]
MFTEIPLTRPSTPLLDLIDRPAQLRTLDQELLPQLANELRHYMMYAVGKSGGHFGAGLGVVELTIALHYVFNTPEDKLVWDVGHQTYPHKILTGRRDDMTTLRQRGGIAGFPKRSESEYDTFGVGHSSTSISAALGMALASRAQGRNNSNVAIIGDGALTAGMAFEALNHASHTKANMIVILNDNEMSISENVGGLSNYLSRVWASRTYNSLREGGKKVLENMPAAMEFVRRTEEHMKGLVSPGTLFEELGFNYIGPIDGHNLDKLVTYLGKLREIPGPHLLHVFTRKGRGFYPAEQDPIGYHALSKIEPKPPVKNAAPKPKPPKYSDVFGQWLCDMAQQDKRLVGITPAMREGSGMVEFSRQFPDQYEDVAIAEQHAVTLAAGLACEGQKPVVAIYSTFLQRAYDQLIHDVALQNLDVTFGIDRAGLVGEDGPTHAGAYDLSFMRCIPNMLIMAPSDENECRQMLYTGYQYTGPAAIRYPRGTGTGATIQKTMTALPIGKGRMVRRGSGTAILAFGALVTAAKAAGDTLSASVADMRFIKPIDEELILELANTHELLVTVEENAIQGGAGSAVCEVLAKHGIVMPILNLGIPDYYVDHGKPTEMIAECGLNAEGIEQSIRQRLDLLARNKLNKNAV